MSRVEGSDPGRRRRSMLAYPRALTVGLVVVLGVGLVSCDAKPLPTTAGPTYVEPQTPAPTTPNQSWVTVSGVVFDHTTDGAHPRANVLLLVHAWRYPDVFMWVTSDSMGRYSLSGVPAGA